MELIEKPVTVVAAPALVAVTEEAETVDTETGEIIEQPPVETPAPAPVKSPRPRRSKEQIEADKATAQEEPPHPAVPVTPVDDDSFPDPPGTQQQQEQDGVP